MNREERIRAAREKVEKLKPANSAYLAAERELACAISSFDIGERVRVTETCGRGCCIDRDVIGTIIRVAQHGRYVVLDDAAGAEFECWGSDMRRV